MHAHPILRHYPELKELLLLFRNEVPKTQRPATEVKLNDQDVMKMLSISKRKLDYLKAYREIPYPQPKANSSCYYLISDILLWLKTHRAENFTNKLNIPLHGRK